MFANRKRLCKRQRQRRQKWCVVPVVLYRWCRGATIGVAVLIMVLATGVPMLLGCWFHGAPLWNGSWYIDSSEAETSAFARPWTATWLLGSQATGRPGSQLSNWVVCCYTLNSKLIIIIRVLYYCFTSIQRFYCFFLDTCIWWASEPSGVGGARCCGKSPGGQPAVPVPGLGLRASVRAYTL